ncbi:hypothetical protein ACFVV7_37370, partial [Streptomyces globisporus]|uniref:hypothetical protein n=1 Tax=Streptomyces globisporus TaxID=1908 RepID=UPI0036DC293C
PHTVPTTERHPMPDTTPTPADRPADQLRAAVWVDGDPLMEAMAAAVYEQCDKHPEVSVTIDDPRTIAAVAATVARQLLGTSVAEGASTEPEPDAGLRDRIAAAIRAESSRADDLALADAVMPVVTDRLRRNWGEMRDRVAELETEAQRLVDAAPPAPADRAAHYREAANGLAALGPLDNLVSAPAAWTEAIETLRCMADQIAEDEAAAGVQPPISEEDAPVCGDQYDESTCQLDPGHTGSHADWNRAWDYGRATPPAAPAAPEEPTR